MKNSSKKLFFLTLSSLLLLTGCQPAHSGSQSDSSSIDGNGFYNEANFVSSSAVCSQTKLVTYDGPSIMETSSKVSVKVENQDLFVYETRVNHGRVFSWDLPTTTAPYVLFDFEGKVHVEITVLEDVTLESAVVRPLVYGITPTISAKTLSFDLDYTGNYVVEYNGDPDTAIHIFSNPIETEEEKMTPEEASLDAEKIYVGPGVYYAGAFPISSNTEIYLAGGAYVYGQFSAEHVDNVWIHGRGIVSGSVFNRRSESEYTLPFIFRFSSHVTIEDLLVVDPAGWALTLYDSQDSLVDGLKIITARQNGDGVSIQSCTNVEVRNCFVRTWDDSLVVKNSDGYSTEGVYIHNNLVWTDLAQSMEVGYETYGDTMNNIRFEDIIVLHNFHKAVISMHNCDNAVITNVSYKRIIVEDAQDLGDDRNDGENDFLIDFTIAFNPDWTSSGAERGSINGVTIEDVKVYHMLDTISARFLGESETSTISNVSIKGLEIEGRQISSLEDLQTATNVYTSKITVSKSDAIVGAKIALPYSLSLTQAASISQVDGVEQEGMIVPSFAYLSGGLPYIGEKASLNTTNKATHGAGTKTTTLVDDGSSTDYTKEGNVGNLTDGSGSTPWLSADWQGQDSEFAGVTMDFSAEASIGKIRIKGDPGNEYYYTYSIEIWVRKIKSDGTMNPNYVRYSASKDYVMSPSSGNAIDINITTQVYGGIQLRLFHGSSASAPKNYEIAEVEFYPPSLSYNKAIVDATAHNDVYNVEKAFDGDPTGTSYYESVSCPAYIVVDLGAVHSISTVVLCLPPSLSWPNRTQNITLLASDSNVSYDALTTSFTTISASKDYLFDASAGNRVMIAFDSPVPCRFFKIVINSNSTGYGAQLSEVSVYGV
jgi:Endopolygalacturonase